MKALIKSQQDLQQFVKVPDSVEFDELSTEMVKAQKKYLSPIMGEFFEDVLSWNDGPGILDNQQKTLLELCKAPVASLAIVLATPRLNVNASGGGFSVTTGENHAPASEWRVRDYQNSYFREAQESISELIKHLLENSSWYDDWHESTDHDNLRSGLLSSADQMNEFIEYEVSHFLFLRLRPVIKRIEETIVRKMICSDLYSFLQAEVRSGGDFLDEQDNDYTPLMPFLRRAVTTETIIQAFEPLRIQLDSTGFFVNYSDGSDSLKQKRKANSDERYQILKALQERAADDWKSFQDHLMEFQNEYELYVNSPCFHSPQETTEITPSGIFPAFGIN